MGLMGTILRELQQFRGRIDATNMIGLLPVEGKIQPGANTNVEHAAAGGFSDPLSERYHLFLLHHEVEHPRKQPTIVKAHRCPPGCFSPQRGACAAIPLIPALSAVL